MVTKEYGIERLKDSVIIDKALRELNDIVEYEIKKALNSTDLEIKSITILNALRCFGSVESSNTLTSTSYSYNFKDYIIKIKINGYLYKIIDSAFKVLAEEYKNVGYDVDELDTVTENGFRINIRI